jgi:hypothetical protein
MAACIALGALTALRPLCRSQAAEKTSQHAQGAKESAQQAAAGTQERAQGMGEVRCGAHAQR